MRDMICFDMDGTIADLYSVENWLDKLTAEDVTPYLDAKPLVNMRELNEVCALLQKAGYEIQIITAMSKNASPEYKKAIRAAKKAWLDKWGFIYDHFHGIDYSANKYDSIRRDKPDFALLIDDEKRHLDKWKGETINASEQDVLEMLGKLIPADF